MKALLVSSLLQAGVCLAHYTFSEVILNGKAMGGDYEYIRAHTNSINPQPSDRGAFNSTDLRCNKGSRADGKTKTLTVTAGDQIGFKLQFGFLIDHPGPSFVYLSKAPESGVATYDGSGDWFKVFESGLCTPQGRPIDPQTGWCIYNSDRVNYTIPATLPPGEYLARVENLAIHYAFLGQVQVYAECAQIKVVNTTGTGKPGPMVKIPGLYSNSDPGLSYDVNAYPVAPPYIMPGPAVWTG
jgi:hypothetical protein